LILIGGVSSTEPFNTSSYSEQVPGAPGTSLFPSLSSWIDRGKHVGKLDFHADILEFSADFRGAFFERWESYWELYGSAVIM